MKKLGLLLCTCFLFSCGKKVTDDHDDKVVSVSPGLTAEEDTTVAQNEKFTLSVSKMDFKHDEVIMITIENTGESPLNHLAFSFEGAPSSINVTRINCFDILDTGESCNFAAVYNEVTPGEQTITASYSNYGAQMELSIVINMLDEGIADHLKFLYENFHTQQDCRFTRIKQKDGEVTSIEGEDFCSFRSINYAASERSEIEENPLEVFNTNQEIADEYYCPQDWSLGSFSFAKSIVKEKKNVFGSTRDVEIPPGESREVCVKYGVFSCSKKKVFYSRLTKVHCY